MVIPDLQRIGKYDILERIADGGFATLYRGRDPFLKRLVAIKVCASEDPELRQQFLREAEIAGNLDHPSIVRTFDFGFDPVGPYLVQEYLQGEDLSRLIAQRTPLSPRRKLDLLIQIAEGLSYSHSRLVLHLDVKPGNVRVIGRRHAKILDFGIARLATSDAAPASGGMVGTAGYLPPEQMMGRSVDARADVFAFGALAYELLTFCRPFTGGTIPELLRRVLAGEAEPMRRHWPDCNDALANVIGRCLRRDPAARYASFEQVLPDLISIRDGFPEVAEVAAAEAAALPVEIARDAQLAEAESAPEAALVPEPAAIEPAAIVPAAIASPAAPAPARGAGAARSKGVLFAGLAAAAAAITIAIAVLLPSREPSVAAAVPAPDAYAPPASAGPSPGTLVITAVPWGEVKRVEAADGSLAELPENRVTPLRLWLAPGPHRVDVELAGGTLVSCTVEVIEGGTHPCRAAPPGERSVDGTDYWKEMGWWQ